MKYVKKQWGAPEGTEHGLLPHRQEAVPIELQ